MFFQRSEFRFRIATAIIPALGVLLFGLAGCKDKPSPISKEVKRSQEPGSRSTTFPTPVPASDVDVIPDFVLRGGLVLPHNTASIEPEEARGDQAHDWALKYERTTGGPEADLVVRAGDINNLGLAGLTDSTHSPGIRPRRTLGRRKHRLTNRKGPTAS